MVSNDFLVFGTCFQDDCMICNLHNDKSLASGSSRSKCSACAVDTLKLTVAKVGVYRTQQYDESGLRLSEAA